MPQKITVAYVKAQKVTPTGDLVDDGEAARFMPEAFRMVAGELFLTGKRDEMHLAVKVAKYIKIEFIKGQSFSADVEQKFFEVCSITDLDRDHVAVRLSPAPVV